MHDGEVDERGDTDSPSASVIVPAHNEERTIRRTLHALLTDARPGDFDVVVVCNGCTDRTAEEAAAVPGIRLAHIDTASKALAIRRGADLATTFPRIYLDADVQLDTESLRRLAAAVAGPDTRAAGPSRHIPRDRCSRAVAWYYDVWERLPQVREGLFGRGVIALSAAAAGRVDELPMVLSDDLAISDSFGDDERRVVPDATVTITPPMTLRALVNRRVRVATGVAQLRMIGKERATSRTSISDLVRIAWREPRIAPRVPVFLAVTLAARARSRRAVHQADFTTWQRDESSRQ